MELYKVNHHPQWYLCEGTEENYWESLTWQSHSGLGFESQDSHLGRSAAHSTESFGRLRLKCDGTRAETRFCLSAKRTSPFKSVGSLVQSASGSRGVRIGGSNAGYTMFRGSVKGTGYSLHSPVSPLTSPPVRHRASSHFNWNLPYSNDPEEHRTPNASIPVHFLIAHF